MSSLEKSSDELLLSQAVEWYWELADGDVSPARIVEWQEWLDASSRNSEAYARIERTLERVGGVRNTPWPTESEVRDDAYDGRLPVSEWRKTSEEAPADAATVVRPTVNAKSSWGYWALAASIVLAVTLGAVTGGLFPWLDANNGNPTTSYSTGVAEHRDVQLPDGSTTTLGAKSMLAVRYTREQRLVIVDRGQAYFEVAHEVDRPFVVNAGGRKISAVGTAFNVTQQQQRVVVTVTEGAVLVLPETPASPSTTPVGTEAVRLKVGQQLAYDRRSAEPIVAIDVAEAVAWRYGQMRYRSESLRYVIEDVNRYAARPVIIGDQAAGDLLFTGTVFQQSIPAWLEGLEQAFPVKIEDTPAGLVMRYRADTSR